MSKLKEKKQYERTFSYKFFGWLRGEQDPYLNVVEMKKQKERRVSEAYLEEINEEHKKIVDEVYDIEHNKNLKHFQMVYRVIALLFCVALTFFLLLTISFLPATGDAAKATSSNEVEQRYIEQGLQETGSVNIVTGMILTYRAFDTFGETNVLFIATVCVMIMLMVDDAVLKEREQNNDRRFEPKNDVILQKVAFVLVPIIIIFGIYIVLNGQISPGGGFSGGAILGAALILHVSAFGFKKTEKIFNEEVYRVAKVTALCMYGLIGLYYYTMGANGLNNHIPLGIPGHILSGGIILPIDICVGVEVACTMYAFYALFRRGGL